MRLFQMGLSVALTQLNLLYGSSRSAFRILQILGVSTDRLHSGGARQRLDAPLCRSAGLAQG